MNINDILLRADVERIRQRLLGQVAKHPVTECWEWQAGRSRTGYGHMRAGNRSRPTHRLAWVLFNGLIPQGVSVLHRCDNPPCCNPAHLFLGTQKDNAVDMARKGRTATALLSAAQVRAIRADTRTNNQRIADDYGVSRGCIRGIKHGVNWAWLD